MGNPLKQRVRSLLGENFVSYLHSAKSKAGTLLSRLTCRSKLLTSLRFGLFSSGFSDEHLSVSWGAVLYENYKNANSAASSPELRRNIHRLEKGLIMRPRRKVFAIDYITRTVEIYEKRARKAAKPTAELVWAHDVLSAYFRTVEHSGPINAAFQRFNSIALDFSTDAARVPFKRTLDNPVSLDSLMALSRQRRSVRWFKDQPVPRSAIDRALEVAAQAPSACNRQSFYYRIFDDPGLIQEVAAIPGGAEGFRQNFPAYAVVIGRLRAYPQSHDRHVIYVDGALSTMAFVYALETLGLATCLVNWGDHPVKNKRIAKLLKLAPDERVITTLAIGYPDLEALVPYSQKKEVSRLRAFNQDEYRD